jgi:hypothetical protein
MWRPNKLHYSGERRSYIDHGWPRHRQQQHITKINHSSFYKTYGNTEKMYRFAAADNASVGLWLLWSLRANSHSVPPKYRECKSNARLHLSAAADACCCIASRKRDSMNSDFRNFKNQSYFRKYTYRLLIAVALQLKAFYSRQHIALI